MQLSDFPVQIKIPVAWGDMDAFQHVNNVMFFRYFESARIAYFRAIEFSEPTGVAPILAETSCKFLRPIIFPDDLIVGAKVNSIGNTSFVMEYQIHTEKLGLVAIGEGIVVAFDYEKQTKAPVPDAVREAIQKLEKMT